MSDSPRISPFAWRRFHSVCLAGLFLLALAIRCTNLSFPYERCFDEVYYVSGAQDYLEGRPDANSVHPPLAKIQLAGALLLFDVTKIWGWHDLPDTLGWRLLPAVMGAGVAVLAAWLAYAVTRNARVGLFAAVLVAVDHLSVAEARIVTLDTVQTFWITAGLAAAAHYLWIDRRPRWFVASALALAISTACKWNGLFPTGAVFLALSGLVDSSTPAAGAPEAPVPPRFRFDPMRALKVGLALALTTAAVYSASYLPYRRLYPEKPMSTVVREVRAQHQRMLDFRRDPKQFKHTYLSQFYQWPFVVRPVWFHYKADGTKTCTGIVAFGLLPFWWLSIYLVFETTIQCWRRDSWDPPGQFLVLAYLTQWLLWASSTTGGFFYYMLPAVPVMAVFVGRQLELWLSQPEERSWAYAFGALMVVFAVLYFPFMTGLRVPYPYFKALFFYAGWI